MADTIVPNPLNSQDLNRYSYVRNNPGRYTDPSGHCPGACAGTAWQDTLVNVQPPRNGDVPFVNDSPSAAPSFCSDGSGILKPCKETRPSWRSQANHARDDVASGATAPCDWLCQTMAIGSLAALGADAPLDGAECVGGSWFSCVMVLLPGTAGGGAGDAVVTAVSKFDDAPSGAVRCLANSFVPGTEVLMADGTTKPIEDVEIGDWVWAHDPETGETGPRQVIDTIIGDGEKELVDIEVLGDRITATDGHPFWVTNRGAWVDADDLEVGDQLLLADGATASVAATGDQSAIRRVHNLSVEGIHSYFVEAAGEHVLVHNTSCPPRLHWSSLTGEETTALHTTLTKIRNNDFTGLNRHTFGNVNGQLPEGVNYVIHDVASEASNRGVRRVVTGSDGSVYYTNTHYGDTDRYDFFTITSP